jgi:hypothetical protein
MTTTTTERGELAQLRQEMFALRINLEDALALLGLWIAEADLPPAHVIENAKRVYALR